MDVKVSIRGPFFDKRVDDTMKAAILDEGLSKFSARMTRNGPFGSGGKGLGVKRNTVAAALAWPTGDTGVLTVESTLVPPRVTGRKYADKNMGIIRVMAPRQLNAIAQRVINELG